MSRIRGPRFPFAPLERAIVGPDRSRTTLAERILGRHEQRVRLLLGASHQQVAGWRARGLSTYLADELAVAAGLHPFEVWGPAWLSSAYAEPVCPVCGGPAPHTYCSARCRAAVHSLRRMARNRARRALQPVGAATEGP